MANICKKSYIHSIDGRLKQVNPLFEALESCRDKPVHSKDNVFDIGCGATTVFNEFWNNNYRQPKLVVGLDKQKNEGDHVPDNINLIDTSQDNHNDILEMGRFYRPDTDFCTWQVPDSYKEKFSLATSINSFHWITGECAEDIAKERSGSFFASSEKLLKQGGYLSLLVPLTEDFCSGMTKIAISSMKRLGLDIDKNSYMETRRKRWRIPKSLKELRSWFEQYRELEPKTTLHEKLLLGVSTWYWQPVDQIWGIWSSMNLGPNALPLDPEQAKRLESIFKETLRNEEVLDKMGIQTSKFNDSIYCLLSWRSAQFVLEKKQPNKKVMPCGISPDLAAQVRSALSKSVSKYNQDDLFHATEEIVVRNIHNLENMQVQVTNPIWEELSMSSLVYYTLLRQEQSGGDIVSIATVNENNAAQLSEEFEFVRKQSPENFKGLSEVVFEKGVDGFNDIAIFLGNRWRNYVEWAIHRPHPLAFAVWFQIQSTTETDIDINNNLTLNLPIHCVAHLKFLVDLPNNKWIDGIQFRYLLFLNKQAQRVQSQNEGLTDSVVLTTSSAAIDEKSKSSASITFFPKQNNLYDDFPSSADCFFVLDALQVLAVLRERMKARKIGSSEATAQLYNKISNDLDELLGNTHKAYISTIKIGLKMNTSKHVFWNSLYDLARLFIGDQEYYITEDSFRLLDKEPTGDIEYTPFKTIHDTSNPSPYDNALLAVNEYLPIIQKISEQLEISTYFRLPNPNDVQEAEDLFAFLKIITHRTIFNIFQIYELQVAVAMRIPELSNRAGNPPIVKIWYKDAFVDLNCLSGGDACYPDINSWLEKLRMESNSNIKSICLNAGEYSALNIYHCEAKDFLSNITILVNSIGGDNNYGIVLDECHIVIKERQLILVFECTGEIDQEAFNFSLRLGKFRSCLQFLCNSCGGEVPFQLPNQLKITDIIKTPEGKCHPFSYYTSRGKSQIVLRLTRNNPINSDSPSSDEDELLEAD